MKIYIMSKEEISEYLKKINSMKKEDLVTYLQNNGRINDIDYYVEVQKKYYPESDMLVIHFD